MTHFILTAIFCLYILLSLSSSCSNSYKRLPKTHIPVLTFYLASVVDRIQLSRSVYGCSMAYSSLGQNPTVVSHNIRGLNIPVKRSSLLRKLKKGRPHFAFLQETHFKTHSISRLTDSYFTEAHHATNYMAKSKGVTILISKEANLELTDKLTDPDGRYILLKGKHNGIPTTLANVYFSNSSHLTFCRRLVKEIEGFSSGRVILGGDFNLLLNLMTDTSSGKTYIKY